MHVKIAMGLLGIVILAKVSAIVWGVKSFENLLDTPRVFGLPTWILFIAAALRLVIFSHYKKRKLW